MIMTMSTLTALRVLWSVSFVLGETGNEQQQQQVQPHHDGAAAAGATPQQLDSSSHSFLRKLQNSAPQQQNESSLLFIMTIVSFICIFYLICTFQCLRLWLCHKLLGREAPIQPPIEPDDTILVNDEFVSNLTDDQRRAVLEAIFSESSKKATFLDVGERKRRHRQRSNLVNLNVEIPGIETAGTEASTETHHARNGSGKRRGSGTSSCCGDSQGVVAQVGSGGLNGSGQNEEGNDDDLSQECQVDHDDDLSQESALDDEDDIECAGSETVGGREDDDDDKQAILIDSHIETETNESPLSTATEERSAVPEKSAQEQPVTVQEVDSTAGNEAPSLLPCASTSHSEEDKGDNKSDVADEKAVSELENSEPGSISLYSQLDERGMLNEQPSLKRSDTEESGERVVPASVFRGLDVRDQRKEDDDVEEINGNARKGVENDEAQHDEKNQRHPGQLQMHELRSSKRSTNFIIPEYETAEETKEEIDNEEDNQHDEDTNHEIDFKQLPIPFIRTESFQTVASEYTYGDDDSCTTATGDNVCNICLCGYKMGDMLIASKYCTHVFHKDCILQWLQKHDECPMCRVNMVTDVDMSRAASSLVGKTRMYRAVASMRHPVGGNGLHQGYRQAYAQRYHVNLSQHQGGAARPSPLQGTVRRGASHL